MNRLQDPFLNRRAVAPLRCRLQTGVTLLTCRSFQVTHRHSWLETTTVTSAEKTKRGGVAPADNERDEKKQRVAEDVRVVDRRRDQRVEQNVVIRSLQPRPRCRYDGAAQQLLLSDRTKAHDQ